MRATNKASTAGFGRLYRLICTARAFNIRSNPRGFSAKNPARGRPDPFRWIFVVISRHAITAERWLMLRTNMA